MFGGWELMRLGRYHARLERAKRDLERINQEKQLAKEILKTEGMESFPFYVGSGFLMAIAFANFLGLIARINPNLSPSIGLGLGLCLSAGLGFVIIQDSGKAFRVWILAAIAILMGVVISAF